MRQLKIQKSITNRNSEALDKYLVEIGRAPMVSIEEEIELAQAIKKGGRAGERSQGYGCADHLSAPFASRTVDLQHHRFFRTVCLYFILLKL